MFCWPDNVPLSNSDPGELADYAELMCLASGRVSLTDMSQELGRLEDNDYQRGVEEYSTLDENLQQAMKEIEWRTSACGEGYPFAIDQLGNCIRLSFTGVQSWLYSYLLLATRLNMLSNRNHAAIDGALLFEQISADILKSYFGPRSEAIVFGTATVDAGFEARIKDLCHRLCEGQGFSNRNNARPTARDAKLDVVAWKPFADSREGKVVLFGQCKTGRNWRDQITQLQTEAFCKSWMKAPLAVNPMRLFLVAESVPYDHWYSQTSSAGVIFDRCRLVCYGDALSPTVFDLLKQWVCAAATDPLINLPQLAEQV